MKSKLKLKGHAVLAGDDFCIEVIHDGQLVGCVYGADGPGIRFITKHELNIVGHHVDKPSVANPNIVEIKVRPEATDATNT